MRKLHVSFGQRRPVAPAGWLLLAIGLVCTGLGAWTYLQALTGQRTALKAHTAAIDALRQGQEARMLASRQDARPTYLQDQRWHHAAADLGAPWLVTLHALEQASKPPVFLTGMRSDPSAGRVQIDAQAPSLDEALGYIERLNKARPLRQVRLLRHEEAPDAATGQPAVRFSVQAEWGKVQ